jgi:predicted Zn-dependent protease
MDTEAHILEALRLSPRDIFAFRWMWIAGLAKFQRHADVEAASWMRRSIEANPNQPIGHFLLGAVLAQLGQPNEAQAATQAGLALAPGFTIQRFLAGGSSDNPIYLASRVRLCDGLRMAGVPEA